MTCHVTAPRLLFLYPRVARAALSPDTRGQIILPHFIEPDKDTLASAWRDGEGYPNDYCKNNIDRIRHSSPSNGKRKSKIYGRWETVIAGHTAAATAVAASPIAYRVPREKNFHTSTRCQQSIKPQRYGTANEPPPYLKSNKKDDVDSRKERATGDSGIGDAAESDTIAIEGMKGKETSELREKRNDVSRDKLRSMPGQQHLFRADGRLVEDSPDNEAGEDVPDTERKSFFSEAEAQGPRSKQAKINQKDSKGDESTENHESDAISGDDNGNAITQPSLKQTILQAQSSSELLNDSSQKKLSLRNSHNAHLSSSSRSSRSPYFHHFDTYTMARNLQDGGFSEKQASTVMKAMRVTLTKNLEWAKKALVSKSNVENVNCTVLFFGFFPSSSSSCSLERPFESQSIQLNFQM